MLIPFSELFKKYNIQPKGVLHIGASEGQEASEYSKHGVKHTWWIEALPDIAQKLRRHLEAFQFESVIISNECISDVNDKEVDFHVANNGGQSSSILDFGTHAKEHPTVKFTHDIKLKTKRFDTLVREMINAKSINQHKHLHVDNYDFLNIDLQGAELMALKGMGTYLTGFNHLYVEVNTAELYKGCPLVGDIDEYVKTFGFVRLETKMTGWKWGDAYYQKAK